MSILLDKKELKKAAKEISVAKINAYIGGYAICLSSRIFVYQKNRLQTLNYSYIV